MKEPNYKIFYDEKLQKLIIKYNYITKESIILIEKYIEDKYDKKNKNIKMNKYVKLIFEFISFPFYLFLEIIIIFLLSITYILYND